MNDPSVTGRRAPGLARFAPGLAMLRRYQG